MSPEDGFKSPNVISANVDFPDPDFPIIPMMSFFLNSKFIFDKIFSSVPKYLKFKFFISIEFIYDHELGKYLNSKVKRNYNLDYRNNNHLATFFNYLNTSFGLDEDEMWREIKRTIFIDENDLVDYYREDSHHQVVNLAEIEKTYRDNIIYGYSN